MAEQTLVFCFMIIVMSEIKKCDLLCVACHRVLADILPKLGQTSRVSRTKGWKDEEKEEGESRGRKGW